jgi:hypothetical protein
MILWQFASVNADFGLTIYPNNPSKLRQSRLRRIYDETFLLVCHFVILHAVVLLTNMALTQGQEGCGQGIALVAECYEGTKVVEYGNVCCTPGTFWLWVAGLGLPSLLRGYSHRIPPQQVLIPLPIGPGTKTALVAAANRQLAATGLTMPGPLFLR